ncbi:MAG: PAS domain-containing protein [Bacteroidota bacterium]
MPSPTPAARAAVLGLVAVTLVAVAGAMLHLGVARQEAERELGRSLHARVATLAVTLAPSSGNATTLRNAFQPYQALEWPADLVLFDAGGRMLASTSDDLPRGIDWLEIAAPEPSGVSPVLRLGSTSYIVAAHLIGSSGFLVAAVSPLEGSLPEAVIVQTVTAALSLWGVLAGGLVIMTWYAGPRSSVRLSLLGERVAQGAADGNVLIRHSQATLGSLADAFAPVVDRLKDLGQRIRETDGHVAALYQVNPHYVVLCTFDGEVIEANPAFYAATGLSIEAVRGGKTEALAQSFPVEPLMDLAQRSLREGSAISGIEYAIVDRDDTTRPVEVSLRAFHLDGRDLVLFQATDQAREKTLERRVAAFNDTLDLMVDQRVQQLTAGQQSLRTILDTAGVVVASFDAGGATSRWSGGARALTGKGVHAVPHFSAAVGALGLSPTERTAFTRWFWSGSTDPFVGRHGVIDADGATRVRQLIWQRVDADLAGRSDLRTLIGVEIPSFVTIPPASGDGWRDPASTPRVR